ncbi:MAG: D-amino acid aminotransferase [Formivibrio sp.]|nr:D-amino acid aminotransferase [Formivibrio sp.]
MLIPANIAYLNGRYAPLPELQVSVMDRGFLFGDGVYELVPVYDRRPFRLVEHLRRMGKSMAAVALVDPYSLAQWEQIVGQVSASQDFADQSIYLQVTRGPAWPRSHAFPTDIHPTIFVYAEPLLPPAPALILNGVMAVTANDIRWGRCNIKACSLMANVLLKQMAVEAGADEVILLRDGGLIEGGSSNVFIVRDGLILAPPPSERMLTGITYDVVQELAQAHRLPLVLREISEAEFRTADEVWITSSSKEILAVVELDGRPIGNGVPGPIYRRMNDFYQAFKTATMRPSR